MAKTRKEQVETRVSLALKRIKLVGDLVESFNFTNEEIDKIFDAFENKVKHERNRMKISMNHKERKPFSFKDDE